GLGVAFTQQIAGPLPPEDRARRVAPRRALVGLVAGQKIEEQLRLKQRPCAASWRTAEDLPKQLLRPRPIEKMLLVRGTLVGIPGRDRDTVHAQRLHVVEEPGNALRFGVGEERAVDIDAEALCLRARDRRNRLLVDALLANRPVVHLLVAVELNPPID